MNTTGSEEGSAGPLREALTVCAAAGMSGILRVTGDPGGAVHIAGGLVAAVETPGAPGPEVLLLRSHRVSESGWDEAFAAAAASGGRMSAELARREMAGAGELEWLLRAALADAVFVLASGTVDEYRAEPGPVDFVLPLEPGAEPDLLLAETARRIRVLAALPGRSGRGRIVAAAGAVQAGVRLGEGQDEILALADGRRTARDLAFALGRGVYATMLQVARMQQAGLLVAVSPRAADAAGQDAGHAGGKLTSSGLPRRGKGQPGLLRRGRPAGGNQELPPPAGALRPRYGQAMTTGQVR